MLKRTTMAVVFLLLLFAVASPAYASALDVYRFYNMRTGTHFYTADPAEKANVIATLGAVYHYEGVAYYVPLTAAAPVTTPLVWQHRSGGGYQDMIFDPCPVFSGNAPLLYTMELYAGHRYKIDSNMLAGGAGRYSYVELVAPDGTVTSPEYYSFGSSSAMSSATTRTTTSSSRRPRASTRSGYPRSPRSATATAPRC